VDGLRIRWLAYPQTPLVEGDARSYSIAAASVLAKVTRDRAMREFDKIFPGYGFAEHKGYSTPRHFDALENWGRAQSIAKVFRRSNRKKPICLTNLFVTKFSGDFQSLKANPTLMVESGDQLPA